MQKIIYQNIYLHGSCCHVNVFVRFTCWNFTDDMIRLLTYYDMIAIYVLRICVIDISIKDTI